METLITREELALLVRALENREFKYSMIKDIHKYLLDKIDECAKVDVAKPKENQKETKGGLVPPMDMFTD